MAEEFTRSYKTGEVIFTQGEDGHFACLLREGLVELFSGDGAARVPIAQVQPGRIFGELSLVDGGKRMATARALIPSKVFMLDEKIFRGKLDALPENDHRTFARLIEFVRDTLPHGLAKPGEKGAPDAATIAEMTALIDGAELTQNVARGGDEFLGTLADLLIFYAKRRLPPA